MADKLIFLTGLWKRESKQGAMYLEGRLGVGGKVMVFRNTKKKQSDPDWTLCLGEWVQTDKEQSGSRRREDDDVPF